VADKSNWTLDLEIRNRLSIRCARLQTANRINVIAGRNGCGKSQLLFIVHSFRHSFNDEALKKRGYRNYFLKEGSRVEIGGTDKIWYVHPARMIGSHPDEVQSGPYSFSSLEEQYDIRQRYTHFRKTLSKLAYEAKHYAHGASDEANQWVRDRKGALLEEIAQTFCRLCEGAELTWDVDDAAQLVFVGAQRRDMPFVRPGDLKFTMLRYPFSTLSDGEINVLFLLFELLFKARESAHPILLLVDEIENHMHPSLQVAFMDALAAALPENAVLVATTHSPTILTAVPAEARFLLVHSTAKDRRGNLYTNQLLRASTDVDAAHALYALYGAGAGALAAQLWGDLRRCAASEALRYVEESLVEAVSVQRRKPYDPQLSHFCGFLHALLRTDGGEVRVLDVGAGMGAMVAGLLDADLSTSAGSLAIDAVEPSPERRESLAAVKERSARARTSVRVEVIYPSLAEVPGAVEYDAVLAHNVLHEMSGRELVEFLRRLEALLGHGGLVHILEQEILQEGEAGFCLLNHGSLESLLGDLGYAVMSSSRQSYGGIPLYEITARAREGGSKASEAAVVRHVGRAFRRTAVANVEAYAETSTEPPTKAFLALNAAHAVLRRRELAALARSLRRQTHTMP
jgi:predicted ATPase/2-polyprenyl-3-methyl-5-hydroxy-6-metoxy-1,4-benzoquinol methylase